MFKFCREEVDSESGERSLWLNIFENPEDESSLRSVKVKLIRPLGTL